MLTNGQPALSCERGELLLGPAVSQWVAASWIRSKKCVGNESIGGEGGSCLLACLPLITLIGRPDAAGLAVG